MNGDSLLKLSISLHTSPGVYALLLGSGVSRAAGIPTGWEIVLDLIRKVAKLEGEDPEPNPDEWYKKKFRKQPDYAEILERLASSPADRNAILREYFEPTGEEREQGLKTPTGAHKAIATLVKDGYIRIILTTNFDRLLETALAEQGITPDVISTEDALKGAIPYVHSKCVILKLHGDYRDMRIKNTKEEVGHYSEELNKYLDRILDEFGLIVCGWSANYDTALRNAIYRCPSRRFTTFWACKGKPNDDAERLIKQRLAEIVDIESADKFFTEILEKVEALREMERPHPLSTPMAIATVKRYLSEPKHYMRLHDLIVNEAEKLYAELCSSRFDTHDHTAIEKEGFQKRIRQYEALSETLIGMLAALSYFDRGENTRLLTQCIERIAKAPRQDGFTVLLDLRYYPALLLCYASGIAALAANHYGHLASVLLHPKCHYRDEKLPAVKRLNVQNVFTHDIGKLLPEPNAGHAYTPANNHIFDILREPLRPYLPDDKKYKETFDIFEYILGLTYVDLVYKGEIDKKVEYPELRPDIWAPFGCFTWRYLRYGEGLVTPIEAFEKLSLEQGKGWALLKAGFFNGSNERFQLTRTAYYDFWSKIRWY